MHSCQTSPAPKIKEGALAHWNIGQVLGLSRNLINTITIKMIEENYSTQGLNHV